MSRTMQAYSYTEEKYVALNSKALAKTPAIILLLMIVGSAIAGAYYLSPSIFNTNPPTPSASTSSTPTPTVSPSASPSPFPSPSLTPTPSPTPSPTPTPTPTPSPSPTPTPEPTPIGDNYEPDNNFYEYSTISVTDSLQSQHRSINPTGDLDIIRFYAEAQYTYIFNIQSTIDSYAYIYDSNQNQLASTDGTTGYKTFKVEYNINANGYYFLKVEALIPTIEGNYTLTFERKPAPLTTTLSNAITQGFVQATITGQNLQGMSLSIKSISQQTLNVSIPAGTMFDSNDASTQNMVALYDGYVMLNPDQERSYSFSVACVNMELDTPENSDTFTIINNTPEDLTKLLHLDSFSGKTFRVKQFAVWTITDNPSRYGYTQLGSSGNYSGPTDAEIQEIKTLFLNAGIDTQKYNALK